MEEIKTEEKETPGTREVIVVEDNSDFSNLLDTRKFEHLQRIAAVYAESDLVPDHYRHKKANCIIAAQLAFQLGVNPLTFMQKSYVIKGKPGIEASLAIGLMNRSGLFTDAIQYKFEGVGRTRKCTASATSTKTGQLHEMTVTWAIVEAERWDKKDGSKWLTIPDLMFMWRSAMWLIRTTHPEVILGLLSAEELMDMERPEPINITPRVSIPEGPEEGEDELRAELWQALFKNGKILGTDIALGMPHLEQFIHATAQANGITRSNLMAQAMEKLGGFWEQFEIWHKSHPEGSQTAPVTSQDAAGGTTAPPPGVEAGGNPPLSEKARTAAIDAALRQAFSTGEMDEDGYPLAKAVKALLPSAIAGIHAKTLYARWDSIKDTIGQEKSTPPPAPTAAGLEAQAEARRGKIKAAVIAQGQEMEKFSLIEPDDLEPGEPFPQPPADLTTYVHRVVSDATEEEIQKALAEVRAEQ